MIEFFKQFTVTEGITITISIIAILFTALSYVNDNKKNRRELRIAKLEELLELNIFFLNNYDFLLEIASYRDKIKFPGQITLESVLNNENFGDKESDLFLEIVGANNFDKNLVRFNVLANAYLPNSELKLKCLSLVELNANLYNYAVYKTLQVRETYPKFPIKKDYFDYIEDIEKEITTEMNLGYESYKDKDREKYNPIFRKDLGI